MPAKCQTQHPQHFGILVLTTLNVAQEALQVPQLRTKAAATPAQKLRGLVVLQLADVFDSRVTEVALG